MLSKNNWQEQFRKQEPKKQRFAIKKLTVGVASVLIGFTFMGMSASASADTTPAQSGAAETETTNTNSNTNSSSASLTGSATVDDTKANSNQNTLDITKGQNVDTSAILTNLAVQPATASEDQQTTPAADTDKTFALPEKTQQNTAQVSNYKDFSAALINKNIQYIELQGSGLTFDDATVEADQSSINNGGVGAEGITHRNAIPHYEIALNKLLSSQYDNIGRQLVIEGQGQDKTTLDMGKWYFSFWDANNKDGNHPWNITLKDMTFKTDAAQYKLPSPRAPFVFNGASANGSSVNLVNVNADFGKRGAGLVNSNDKVAANIKDSTVAATGTVIKNGQNAVLDGVTANISNGSLVYTSGNLTVKGQNSVTDDLKSKSNDAFIAKNVNIDDNAVLDLNITNSAVGETDADIDLAGKNNNVFYIGSKNVKTASLENPSDNGNFTVGNNAKITLNSTNVTKDADGSITATQKGLHNLRFIYNVNGQGGNFVVNSGANVDLNMGTGHSVAIQAGNMSIAKDATVDIATLQNNNKNHGVGDSASVTYNGFHWAPVTLGMIDTQIGDIDLTGKNSTDAEINGTLKIIRGQKSKDIDVQSPLIGFGSGSTNEKQTFTLNVNKGATLDLQDSSSTAYDTAGASPIAWNKALDWIGTNANVNRLGLITMFGTGATNNINFNAPQYINLQRRGSQIGSALRTEGLHNHIIAKNDATKGTPLAQWNGQNASNTPDEAWRIQNIDAQVAGGNFFSNFLPAGAKAGDKGGDFFTGDGYLKPAYFGTPFDKSQGTAQLAPFMGNYAYENGSYTGDSMAGVHGIGLTQLTNDFNYWSPRRITFGENKSVVLPDSVNYEPETQAITKTTKDNLESLTKKDLQNGIKDLKNSDNTVAQDHATILGDSSLINWEKSNWGLDWTKTDFTEDGHLRKDPNATLTTAQQNVYNALKKIADVAPATDPATGKFAKKTSGTGDNFNGRVATIVYTDDGNKDSEGNPIVSADFVLVPINVTDKLQADEYEPSYEPVTAPQGQTTNDPIQWQDNKPAPEGTKFATAPTVPSWVNVDPTTGNITLKPGTDVKDGTYSIPVTVTYPDGSSETKNADVTVTGKNGDGETNHVYYGESTSVEFSADALDTHKTDQDNKLDATAHGFNKIVFNSEYDHTTGKYGKTTIFNYDAAKKAFVGDNGVEIPESDFAYDWQPELNGVVTPNTNWKTIKSSVVPETTGTTLKDSEAEKTQKGESLVGNSKYRYNFTLNADAAGKLGLGKSYSSWVNAFYNFYGATPKDDAKLEIKASEGGVDGVTSEALATLVNHDDLDNNNQGVKDYVWGTKPTFDKDGKITNTPSVKIEFNDGTTLTVPVSDSEKNNITYNDDTNAQDFTQVINFVDGKGNKLGNTSLTGKYSKKTPGSVSAADLKTAIDNALKTDSLKGWTVDGSYPAAVTGINSATPKAITVTLKHGTKVVNPGDVKPGDKDKDAYKDMFSTVTRTINVTNPDGSKAEPKTDTANFQRPEVLDEVTGLPATDFTGDINGVHFTNGFGAWDKPSQTFAKVDEPNQTVNGKNYITWINGKQENTIPEITVKPGDKSPIYTVIFLPEGEKPSQADSYTPEGQDVKTAVGVVPDAKNGIANISDLPSDATYTWKTTPDVSQPGTVKATVVVTYKKDGSTDEVPVNVLVSKSDADTYNPTYPEIVTQPGQKIPETSITWEGTKPQSGAVTSIAPGANVPSWVQVDKDGNITGTVPAGSTTQVVTVPVTVTYKDGSKDTATATIVIVSGKPSVTNPTDPKDVINNPDKLPEGTTVTWKPGEEPDPNKTGEQPTTVIVKVPGQAPIEIPTKVTYTHDVDKYTPEPQPITVDQGQKPKAEDGIKNKDDLPKDTTYTFEKDPDTTTPGDKPVTIIVHYPDGTSEEVKTTVHVTSDAEKYTPETQPITTPEGKVPDPSDGIKNKDDLPEGTKYTWADPEKVAKDVKTPGTYNEVINVKYPDGSQEQVTVQVTVPAPEGQDINTDQGVLPDPSDAIANKDQMPDGTKYEWIQTPDVNTPGDHTGVVRVTFPDGSYYDVTVTVHVAAAANDNTTTNGNGNGKVEQTSANVNTNNGNQAQAKKLPQTGNNSSEEAAVLGLGLASLASLFGLGGLKKRNADK